MSLKRFKEGQRWRSRFNGDSFVVKDVFMSSDYMRVLWDSKPDYLADVWEWDVRPLQLERIREPQPWPLHIASGRRKRA